MKRIIALLLVAVMMLTMFVACNTTEPEETGKPTDAATEGNKPTDEPTEPADEADLEAAKAFLKAQVLKNNTELTTAKSFDVPAQIKIGTLLYTVEWASSIEAVTIAESATAGFATVTVPTTNEEETPYTLTATIKYGEESVQLAVSCILPVLDLAGITSDLEEEVAYKMFLYQANFAQNLYATHAMDQDKYYKTTNNAKEAPDFFAEKVDGGYKFYTMIEGAKKYVNAYLVYDEANDKYSKRLNFVDATDNVWTYEADTNAWFVNLAQGEETVKYVLGTYGDFKTFCISEASYISASNTGISQFPANFITKEVAESKTPDEEQAKPIPQMENPLQPVAGTAYKFGFVHGGKNNAVYYVTGSMSSYYLATSENIANGANFYVEATEGGFYLYFLGADSAKTYLNVIKNDTHINAVYAAEPATVYVWDAELKTLKTALEGTDYIIGTSATGTYTTLQPAKTTGSFYAQFVAAPEGGEETPDTPAEAPLKTITELNAIGNALENKGASSAEAYRVFGVITEIKNTQYGNFYITDSTGATLYVYGLYDAAGARYDALETKPVVGDYVELEGVLSNYNGAQMKNATLKALTKPSSITDLNTAGEALENKGASSEEMYLATGVITEVKNTQYGNFYIKDAEGNTLYVYGLYNEANQRYDALEVKPAVGDTVVLYGVLSNYNGAQMKNATLVALTVAPVEEGGEEGGSTTPPTTPPTTTATNKFDVTVLPIADTSSGNDAGSYKDRTSTDGWVATGCRVDKAADLTGTDDPVLTLNGKTSAAGSLKSPTLANGISKLSFNYGFAFGDNQLALTINIKKGDEIVATTKLDKTGLEKNVVYSFTWELETAIEGEFTFEIINACKSAQNSNKDRVAIWNLGWEN